MIAEKPLVIGPGTHSPPTASHINVSPSEGGLAE